ncbi:helix-turn-helix domain-containing protein [Candidatus Pacearchaeota archaeon]|nr:helix-turn-helix domain-containing protein [Candidatus Pacearchaeota archaeon]
MFGIFNKKAEKREVEQLKQAVQTGFNSAKQDINNMSKWIKHLDSNNSEIKDQVLDLSEELASVKDELENLKNMVSILGERGIFKQRQTVFNKQTGVSSVLNSVQTPVQTGILDNLSITERAIMFTLLNAGDMKLSYEDLAAMLGKDKATIRGQVNSIRQKNEGLLEEIVGENNKKRLFIPLEVRDILLKAKKIKSKEKKRKEMEDY